MRNLRRRLRGDGVVAYHGEPELSRLAHGLWCLSVVLVVVAGAILGPGVAGAVFRATTTNGPSTFTAAATFQNLALYAWGINTDGQIGRGDILSPVTAPHKIDNSVWRNASSGFAHACAVRTDDTLWCWGANLNGQLGRGNIISPQVTPIQVPGAWQTVSTGRYHTCAIKTDATMWCWGKNSTGAVGTGGTTDVLSPTLIAGSGWNTISGGADHTCGTQSDGTLWCWGVNSSGAIGTGDTSSGHTTPTKVTGTGWRSVVTGWESSCGIKTDNTMWCWGGNTMAQLGRGGKSNAETTPALVSGAANWRSAHAGYYFYCGVKNDDTLWCWGQNENGQLGRGSTSNFESTIVQVAGGAVWSTVGGGNEHACAIRTDATLWCWGENEFGQLATGNITDKTTPTQVTGTGWQYLGTGKGDETLAIR